MAHHHRVKLGYDLCAQIIIKSAQDNLSLVGFLGSEPHFKSYQVKLGDDLLGAAARDVPR